MHCSGISTGVINISNATLSEHWVRFGVEDKLVQTDDIRISKDKVEILEDLSEEKSGNRC